MTSNLDGCDFKLRNYVFTNTFMHFSLVQHLLNIVNYLPEIVITSVSSRNWPTLIGAYHLLIRQLDLLLYIQIFTTNYVTVISKSRNPENVLHLILTADNRGLHHPEYADIQGKTL
jgi:hypothetical protein